MWHPIVAVTDIPPDRDLRLAVLEGDAVHALVFACRRAGVKWLDAKTGRPVEVYPSHRQEWDDKYTTDAQLQSEMMHADGREGAVMGVVAVDRRLTESTAMATSVGRGTRIQLSIVGRY